MQTRERKWRERQARIAARKPQVRIDRCTVRKLEGDRGYEATIEGFNLRQAISPPQVIVGGVPAEALTFEPDGKQLRVRLKREPGDDRVVVDYGFARAEWARGPRGA